MLLLLSVSSAVISIPSDGRPTRNILQSTPFTYTCVFLSDLIFFVGPVTRKCGCMAKQQLQQSYEKLSLLFLTDVTLLIDKCV